MVPWYVCGGNRKVRPWAEHPSLFELPLPSCSPQPCGCLLINATTSVSLIFPNAPPCPSLTSSFPPTAADSFDHKKFFQMVGLKKKSADDVKKVFHILDKDKSGFIEEDELG